MTVSVADWNLAEVYVPAAPGSLMRAVQLWNMGKFRLARRSCELYSVQITSAGAWGRVRIYNGVGRLIFYLQSAFPGSFWLGAGMEEGLIVVLESQTSAPTLTVNFREPDLTLV